MRHLTRRALQPALRRPLGRGVTAAVAAGLAVLLTAGPAAADTTPTSTAASTASSTATAAAPTAAPTPGSQAELAGQYSSLAGALLNYYAASSGKTLADYLAGADLLLPGVAGQPTTGTPAAPSTLPGAPATGSAATPVPAAGGATPLQATTLGQLNTSLAGAGVTLQGTYDTLAQLGQAIAAKSNTPDGAVALAGAQWATQLAALHTPALTAPSAGSAAVPQVPQGALAFGLFLDNSVANLINKYPSVFAQVSKSGLGTAAAQQAWNNSMLAALKTTQTSLSSAMPDQCAGGMLAVMATGNPSSAGQFSCGSDCTVGGLYLFTQAQKLFDHSGTSAIPDPTSSVWSSGTYSGLQDWQKAVLAQQNPTLNGQLSQALSGSTGACSTASAATSGALGSALPGIFGQLTPAK